jgi:predicted Fe-S protein YdhL (DUF1289 family)
VHAADVFIKVRQLKFYIQLFVEQYQYTHYTHVHLMGAHVCQVATRSLCRGVLRKKRLEPFRENNKLRFWQGTYSDATCSGCGDRNNEVMKYKPNIKLANSEYWTRARSFSSEQLTLEPSCIFEQYIIS